jgi:enolase
MVHKRVAELLKERFPNYPIGLGDEKAWVATLSDIEAMKMLSKAILYASKNTGIEIVPAIDIAASEFYVDGAYNYKGKKLTRSKQIEFISGIVEKFSVRMIEDPLEENDFEGFAELTNRIGRKTTIIGDDLFVTNKKRLEKGIRSGAANGILIKPNQIGTLSDMIETVTLAKKHNYETVISHRSGETEDSTIAHLAVGLGIKYIKTGTIGGERTAKHNELIRIEEAESD